MFGLCSGLFDTHCKVVHMGVCIEQLLPGMETVGAASRVKKC